MASPVNLWLVNLIVSFVLLWFPGNFMDVLARELPSIIIGNLSYVSDDEPNIPMIDDDRDLIFRVKEDTGSSFDTNSELSGGENAENDTSEAVYDSPLRVDKNISNVRVNKNESTDIINNTPLSETTLSSATPVIIVSQQTVNLDTLDKQSDKDSAEAYTTKRSILDDETDKPIDNDTVSEVQNSTVPITISDIISSVKPSEQKTTAVLNTTDIGFNTTRGQHETAESTSDVTKKVTTHTNSKTKHGEPYHAHHDQHAAHNGHQLSFRHHHLQLVPMEDEPFGAVILKDQRYVVSVMIPIGVGIVGAAIIIVTLYTLRYIARKNAREFHFPDFDHPRPHTSCISSISSERTDRVVLLGGDEDDEF